MSYWAPSQALVIDGARSSFACVRQKPTEIVPRSLANDVLVDSLALTTLLLAPVFCDRRMDQFGFVPAIRAINSHWALRLITLARLAIPM